MTDNIISSLQIIENFFPLVGHKVHFIASNFWPPSRKKIGCNTGKTLIVSLVTQYTIFSRDLIIGTTNTLSDQLSLSN